MVILLARFEHLNWIWLSRDMDNQQRTKKADVYVLGFLSAKEELCDRKKYDH